MFYKKVLEYYQKLWNQIKEIEERLKALPEGTMFISQNGKYYKWYYTIDKKTRYLPKEKIQFAKQLAEKKYLLIRLKELKCESQAIEQYLKYHKNEIGIESNNFLNNPGYKQLLFDLYRPVSDKLYTWMNEEYETNLKYPEQLKFKTHAGRFVRSKSEVMIDTALRNHKIPYRYECKLVLGNVTMFPDFTIRHPKTGEYYYWEHFGLMDKMIYCENACKKIQTYSYNGILPFVQLITTYESAEHPLNPQLVDDMIKYFFL